MQIRTHPNEGVDISAPPSELQAVRAAVHNFLKSGSAHLEISADAAANPAPYSQTLAKLVFEKTDGPVLIKLEESTLHIGGSADNLSNLAEFFDFHPDSFDGAHYHYDNLDGGKYVHPDSPALVISVNRSR